MTPKDKAKKLVEKFNSKEDALICVQEIINANPQSNPFNTKPTYSTIAYWKSVKKEIENL